VNFGQIFPDLLRDQVHAVFALGAKPLLESLIFNTLTDFISFAHGTSIANLRGLFLSGVGEHVPLSGHALDS